jgi:DNA polymerase-1
MIQRRSFNFPVQGSGSDVTKLAACYMFDYILENKLFNKVKIVNLVHDEILIECPTSVEDKIAKKLEECMVKSGKIFFTRIPLEAEASIGNYWIH